MIIRPFNVLNSAGVATISLSPNTGESILITDICVIPTAAITEFLTIQVNRQTVGFYHMGTTIMNHLPWQDDDQPMITLMKHLQENGIDTRIPVAEGETCTLTAPSAWTRLMVTYEVHGAGDITAEMPNGSKSNEYVYVNYGSNLATIAVIGYYTIDGTHNPVEFPDFPFGETVPSRNTIELLGIGFSDITRAGATFGTDDIRTTFLRLYRDREVLFDSDRVGLAVPGLALGGAANTTTYYGLGVTTLPYGGEGTNKKMNLFPEPLVFEGGDELAVQLNWALSAGGGTVAIADVFCALVLRVKRSA